MNIHPNGFQVKRLSQAEFRRRLAGLLDEFLSCGGDPWWMSREISLAAMQALDSLRADLVECDEDQEEAPY
jgi:hypothetical protein